MVLIPAQARKSFRSKGCPQLEGLKPRGRTFRESGHQTCHGPPIWAPSLVKSLGWRMIPNYGPLWQLGGK